MANDPQQSDAMGDTPAQANEPGATVVQHPAVTAAALGGPERAEEPPAVDPMKAGDLDDRGNVVQYIYARDPHYVVYYSTLAVPRWHKWWRFGDGETRSSFAATHSWEGVQAQLSNNATIRQTQRKNLLPLGVERAKLQSLLRDWPRRQGYDGSIATALQMALDSDGKDDDSARQQALRILTGARASLSREWDTKLRGRYAVYLALLGSLGFWGLVLLHEISHSIATDHTLDPALVGATAGLVGAILSIAIGLRRRSMPMESGTWGIGADCFLRLLIGAVSGGTLVLLLMTGLLPKLKTSQDIIMDSNSPPFIMLLGIVAGFVERLIPSLLEREGTQLAGGGDAKPAAADAAGKQA